MAKHLHTGKIGEAYAKNFLQQKGWTILETNWRIGRAEVDIIGLDGAFLVFVEVKTRSSVRFGHPAAFVSAPKEDLLTAAAQGYMDQIHHTGEFRFDIVSVLLLPGVPPLVEHFPDAFFPGF